MKFVTMLATLAACALAGCGAAPTTPDGRQLTPADAGPPPADPEQAFRSALRPRLKDPDSAQVRMLGQPRAVVVNRVAGMTNGGAGWRLCAEVNAKNSYGGYTGYKRIYVLWQAGRVVDYLGEDLGNMACRNAENE